jgi:2-polyprenyl-6-methoxyphenol hydroxylase-like FAD-dependent oxidoreductase
VIEADVLIVGAGPTGLMLASELCLAGVRPVVVERRARMGEVAKANALVGQILQLLHYRGILDRFEAASPAAGHVASGYPFGNVYVRFTGMADPPLGMPLPQPDLERLLDERARELGSEIHRGHELTGLMQDEAAVTADVRGPDGAYRVAARYVVGCDGPRSRVRDLAGISFSGMTYPEVNRLGRVTLIDSAMLLENGDLDVPGAGIIHPGFTPTDRGVFAFAQNPAIPGALSIQTTEDQLTDIDDDAPFSLTELEESIRRVLGADLPIRDPERLTRYRLHARQAERYREKRIFIAGDAAHQFPATGIGLNVGMLDAVNLAWKLAADINGWAPAGLLDTYHDERSFAAARTMLQTQAQVGLRRGRDAAAIALREVVQELLIDEQPARRLGALIAGTDIRYQLPNPNQHALTGTFADDLTLNAERGRTSLAELMHTARPTYLDVADRRDLRAITQRWGNRIDICIAQTEDRPADALLIRPDAHVAWAAARDEPPKAAAASLEAALHRWFGSP